MKYDYVFNGFVCKVRSIILPYMIVFRASNDIFESINRYHSRICSCRRGMNKGSCHFSIGISVCGSG